MIRVVIVTLLLLGPAGIVFAQSDYRPGYIITLDSDTLSGYLRYFSRSSRFDRCLFRTTPDGESTTYTPSQLIGYRFKDDSYYASRSIKSESEVPKLYFAEVLVSGKKNLLKIHEKFYLEDSKHDIYVLKSTVTEINNEKGKFIRAKNEFMGILKWQFSDCPSASEEIKNLTLIEKDLTAIFELYNSCFNSKPVSFKTLKPWTQIYIGFNVGGMITTLSDLETLPVHSIINTDQFKKDKGIFFGLNYTLTSPRISERFSLNIDMLYQKVSHESVRKQSNTYDVVVFEYTSLRIPVGLRYHINNSKLRVKPLFEVGASFAFHFNDKSYWQNEQENSGTVVINRTDKIMETRFSTTKVFLGVGALYDLNPTFRFLLRFHYLGGGSAINSSLFFHKEQSISVTGSLLFKL